MYKEQVRNEDTSTYNMFKLFDPLNNFFIDIFGKKLKLIKYDPSEDEVYDQRIFPVRKVDKLKLYKNFPV